MNHVTEGGQADPPPYISGNQEDPDELLQPIILVLAAPFIYAQSAETAPLFELSKNITKPPESGSPVSFSRAVPNIRSNPDGTPRITWRTRSTFELKQLGRLLSDGFPYRLESVSRSAIGNLALVPYTSFRRPRFKVVILKDLSEKWKGLPKGYTAIKPSARETDILFEIRTKDQHHEWSDAEGRRIAMEDEIDGRQTLTITACLTKKVVDALVGCWCLRLWRQAIETEKEKKTWRGSMLSQEAESTPEDCTDPFKTGIIHARSERLILPRFW
ncbi:hypothetical protein F4778DRAFT_679241 [Xylariomycetidae sp. FL2044]|nr:hypothetical protein F4778DRAFT_679241 [Xylariomycetidae sp. FL2044]